MFKFVMRVVQSVTGIQKKALCGYILNFETAIKQFPFLLLLKILLAETKSNFCVCWYVSSGV